MVHTKSLDPNIDLKNFVVIVQILFLANHCTYMLPQEKFMINHYR